MKRLVAALFLGIVAFLVRLLRRAFSDEEPGAPSAVPPVERGGDAAPAAVAPSAAPAAIGISPMDTPESSEPTTVRSAATAGSEPTASDAAGPSAAAADVDGAPIADADAASADAAGTLATEAGGGTRAPIASAPAFAATPEASGGGARGNYATPEATVTRVSRPAPAPAVLATTDAGAAGGLADTPDGDVAAGTGTGTGTGPEATGGDVAETDLSLPAGAVRGDGSRDCPPAHPIKGNAGSMIYHIPGSGSYAATIAEFCFGSADEAEAAGFRAPRRG